jgi:phytoene synthase
MSDTPLETALVTCLENVRRMDHDRFLTALLAPAAARPKLIALYAFNAEIARVRETVSEAMLGRIRLQWWREAVEALGQGEVRGHEAAQGLAAAFGRDGIDAAWLTALIDARECDLDDEPLADMAALKTYGEATSSRLMMLAAAALAPDEAARAAARIRAAGIAYALTGLLRALPLHASQGRLYLPLDLLGRHNVDPHEIFAGEASEGLTAIIHAVADEARRHLAEARAMTPRAPRAILPALLPAALCDAYLDRMTAAGFDPFRDVVEMPTFRLQLRLLGRKWRGRF